MQQHQINTNINTPNPDATHSPDPLNCGTYELTISRTASDKREEELREWLGSNVDYTFPTQTLINLNKKRHTITQTKSRLQSNPPRKLSAMAVAQRVEELTRMQAIVNVEIDKVQKQIAQQTQNK